MSLLTPIDLACPRCASPTPFESVQSVNADRRPDMRHAILRGEFQRKTCAACGESFRLDAGFVYVDLGRRQWIAAQPVTGVDTWDQREAGVRSLFESAYGGQAPAAARRLGAGLSPRLVFGWSALREKLIAAEASIDDTVLELLKMAMLRNLDSTPFSADSTLRLIGFDETSLVTAWVRNPDDALAEARTVPRDLYEDIVADLARGDASAWRPVHAEFEHKLFVDCDRMLVSTSTG